MREVSQQVQTSSYKVSQSWDKTCSMVTMLYIGKFLRE